METNRVLIGEQKLIEAFNALDPASDTYRDDLEAISKLYKELAADSKNQLDAVARENEIEVESERLEEDKRSNRKREILDIIGKLVMVGTTVATVSSQVWMFKRSTKKEQDEALLTETDKTVVRNGLSGKWWPFSR